MLIRKKISCPNCDVEYKIIWDDEQEAYPDTCPFCGGEIIDEENE
jgi:Zn-finger nucleic acid-binding protein|tara:strand:+ start:4106 stop:4240 length:135 start_codon:yes stop_codon:yes gene_type:complete